MSDGDVLVPPISTFAIFVSSYVISFTSFTYLPIQDHSCFKCSSGLSFVLNLVVIPGTKFVL